MSDTVINLPMCIRIGATSPEHELNAALIDFTRAQNVLQLLAVDFDFEEYWHEQKSIVPLTAIYRLRRINDRIEIHAAVVQRDFANRHWHSMCDAVDGLDNYLSKFHCPLLDLHNAIMLQPIAIPKPWGREIWYTGIEKRGVALVGDSDAKIPLPWLLAVAPQRLCDGAQQPILLKILDPLPEPVFGDLYFELHREKQEVYVVTAVDREAWPDGVGAIRFGFNKQLRERHGDDRRFISAYLNAVANYRETRCEIDRQLDVIRERERVGLNDPVDATTLHRWLDEIPLALQTRECELREAMEAFTALHPLVVGDVVKVPCLLPHALQHGVRTVEFQTPVYERLILSFAQKVLTQRDWDTARAAELLQLDPPPAMPFPAIAQGDRWRIEQIVCFDDFEVRRFTVEPKTAVECGFEAGYGLGMIVGESLTVNGKTFAPDSALLLPSAIGAVDIVNSSPNTAYFLLALPRSR